METWFTHCCPECKSKNWINGGDMEDQSAPDVTGFVCWKCKKVIRIFCDEWETEVDLHVEGTVKWDEFGSGITVDGLEKP